MILGRGFPAAEWRSGERARGANRNGKEALPMFKVEKLWESCSIMRTEKNGV